MILCSRDKLRSLKKHALPLSREPWLHCSLVGAGNAVRRKAVLSSGTGGSIALPLQPTKKAAPMCQAATIQPSHLTPQEVFCCAAELCCRGEPVAPYISRCTSYHSSDSVWRAWEVFPSSTIFSLISVISCCKLSTTCTKVA